MFLISFPCFPIFFLKVCVTGWSCVWYRYRDTSAVPATWYRTRLVGELGRKGGRETRLVMRPLDGIPVLQIDYLPCTRKSSLFS